MVSKEKLKRINDLANKAKTMGLSDAEKDEQSTLRKEYLATVRASFQGTLDSIIIQEKDGSQTKLKDKRH